MSIGDVARTARVLLTDMPSLFLGMARELRSTAPRSSADEEALTQAREHALRALRHLGIDLEVQNAERVPASGGLVLMWNQTSHLEHLVLPAAIPRPFLTLYNNEVARVPLYGELLRRSGNVHVNRNDEAQWRAAVAGAARRIRAGECFLISPEGTRSRDGRLLPMKRGAFLLATEAACPIVCITVAGAHECLPRGRAVVRRGRIRVVFSEPIAPADTETLKAAVVRTFETG